MRAEADTPSNSATPGFLSGKSLKQIVVVVTGFIVLVVIAQSGVHQLKALAWWQQSLIAAGLLLLLAAAVEPAMRLGERYIPIAGVNPDEAAGIARIIVIVLMLRLAHPLIDAFEESLSVLGSKWQLVAVAVLFSMSLSVIALRDFDRSSGLHGWLFQFVKLSLVLAPFGLGYAFLLRLLP